MSCYIETMIRNKELGLKKWIQRRVSERASTSILNNGFI